MRLRPARWPAQAPPDRRRQQPVREQAVPREQRLPPLEEMPVQQPVRLRVPGLARVPKPPKPAQRAQASLGRLLVQFQLLVQRLERPLRVHRPVPQQALAASVLDEVT